MTKDRMEQLLSPLRQAHKSRPVPEPPLGFDARVMAEIRDMVFEADPLSRLLPGFTMGAVAAAALALVYGVALVDTVPQALAGMYAPTTGFGF